MKYNNKFALPYKFKIYCINLYERDDRYKKMKKQFDNLNMNVQFIRNYKHARGGKYGCFSSHIQAIKDAYSNNLDYCLIIEDDVIITAGTILNDTI